MPVLVYRVDGGTELGLGHLARATALTEVFCQRADWSVRWATEGGSFVESAAQACDTGLIVRATGESEIDFLVRAATGAQAMVIDRQLPYSRTEIEKLEGRLPVVLLDVACEGMFSASAVVFPGAHVAEELVNDPRWIAGTGPARLKHGPEWVVVHPAVRALRGKGLQAAGDGDRIVIATGGTDPANVATLVLDWLDQVPGDFVIDLLVGVANARRTALREGSRRSHHPVQVWERPEEFPARMSQASLAVATFGVTAYELAFLGVPTVLVSHTQENAIAAARLASLGVALDLGFVGKLQGSQGSSVPTRIGELWASEERRRAMRTIGRRLFDGRGPERIADTVEGLVRARSATGAEALRTHRGGQ